MYTSTTGRVDVHPAGPQASGAWWPHRPARGGYDSIDEPDARQKCRRTGGAHLERARARNFKVQRLPNLGTIIYYRVQSGFDSGLIATRVHAHALLRSRRRRSSGVPCRTCGQIKSTFIR